MDWILVLQDKNTLRGTIDRTILLPPGEPHDIPIVMRLDLLDFFANNTRDLVKLALAVAGTNGAHASVALRAVPSVDTPLGPCATRSRSRSCEANSAPRAGSYPNPFNPSTNIAFSLERDGWADLTVFNLLGQKVADLVHGLTKAGRHTVVFDAADLAPGLYFWRLQASGATAVQKPLLVK